RYLTLDQWEDSQSAYRKTIEELNKWLVGPKIPIRERSEFSERGFLPSIDHVPSDQLSWMVERICRTSHSTGDPAAQLVDAVASEFSRVYKRRAIRVSKGQGRNSGVAQVSAPSTRTRNCAAASRERAATSTKRAAAS